MSNKKIKILYFFNNRLFSKTSFFQIDASDLKTIFDHLCECLMNPYFPAKEAQWLKKNLDEHAAVMNSYEQF